MRGSNFDSLHILSNLEARRLARRSYKSFDSPLDQVKLPIMTREEFDVLIRRLEQFSNRHPRLFNARVTGLVALAYSYLGLILLGSLGLSLAMIAMVMYAPGTIKLALVGLITFGGIFWAVLRGLWVKLEAPTGQVITRDQAPKLFALLDELRAALDCRSFEKVLLIPQFNAAVVQIPRLGVFGLHRSYLLLGLPLMQSLAPEEFKAVLAHEFAHSSRGHGRFGNWLYRVRRTWDQVFQQMIKQRSRFGFALFKFVNWFWPLFNGHAFVLSRANEYEADACSVRLAGVDATARALMRLPVDDSLLQERFWPDILARANQEGEPPADVMLTFGSMAKTGAPPAEAVRWLRQALLMETNNADTHPCLKDRLRAIGRLPENFGTIEIQPPPPPPQTAAEFLLDHYQEAARQMSAEWQKAITPQWGARYEQARKLVDDLSRLEEGTSTPATLDQHWEKARKMAELNGLESARPILEQVLTMEPRHAGANFLLGRYYLGIDDPRGITFMEAAIASEPTLTPEGCSLLYAHFNRTGRRDQLRPLEHRLDQFQELAAVAQRERARISAQDTFLPHELKEEQILELKKIFQAEPDLDAAAVVRKLVSHLPNQPCFVVGLRVKAPWWKPRSTGANRTLVNRLVSRIHLPGYFLVFVAEQNLKAVGRKVFSAPDAVIYRKPS